jgi:transcriptional regulatory protein RtcR
MPRRPTVLFGFLGTTLDKGGGTKRWEKWRPTVAACAQPDLQIDRLELWVDPRWTALAERITADIQQVSPETQVCVRPLQLTDPWNFESVFDALADFAASYPFEPESEDYLVHITTGTHVAQICLFLLAESRRIPGRLLQTGPGPDRLVGRAHIIDLDLSRHDRIARRFAEEHQVATRFLKDGIETRNEAFNRLIDRIELVVQRSEAPILLLGPTGSGKSRLARRIYALKKAGRRVQGALVELNCATLRGDGAMSALFGHVRGAFTGAVGARPGLLRAGDGGVVFLDEIGALGLDEQAMLLRALEERRFLPVGSDQEASSDFQLLAGTNQDLAAEVAAGRFRADLLARIDTWTFSLPALRDRREDIAPNLDYELDRVSREGGQRVTMNAEARAGFLRFALDPRSTWDRNFRDLGAAVRRMGTLAQGGRISLVEVDEERERLGRTWAPKVESRTGLVAEVLGSEGASAMDRFDAVQLAEVIAVCRAQPSLAAAGRVLFAASLARRTSRNDGDRLRKYLAKFSLTFQAVQAG